MKKYRIRIYINSEWHGIVINEGLDKGLFTLVGSYDGVGGTLAIYDVETSLDGLKTLIKLGYPYLPLDNYGDFVISCPKCGERIDDSMILRTYDDKLLGGNDIMCNRHGCGCQKAKVDFIG